MSDTQTNCKHQTIIAAVTAILKDMDELANEMTTYRFYGRDGEEVVPVYVRCIQYACDYEEMAALHSLEGHFPCPRCVFTLEAAMREVSEGRKTFDTRRCFIRSDCTCENSQPRTIEYVLKKQLEIHYFRKYGFIYQAEAAAKDTGVNSAVEPLLHRLVNLMPFGPYSINPVDFLHSGGLGMNKMTCTFVDDVIRKNRVTLAGTLTRTVEDYRYVMDEKLGKIPVMRDLPSFPSGYWHTADAKGGSAKNNKALCILLPFTYLDDNRLIFDDNIRNRLLLMHWNINMYCSTLQMPQWISEQELKSLESLVEKISSDFSFFLDHLGNEVTGRGPDVIKTHLMFSALQDLKLYGSVMHGDTSAPERKMKDVKLMDEGTYSSRKKDGTEKVFQRLVANDLDRRLQASEGSCIKM